MNKFVLWMFYIFTFGFGYLYLKNKAKKHAIVVNDELIVTKKVMIDIEKFIVLLGGKENIINTSSSINSIKVFLNDVEKVNQDEIKKLGAKGTILSEGCITCLFGDFSQELSKEMNEKLNIQ